MKTNPWTRAEETAARSRPERREIDAGGRGQPERSADRVCRPDRSARRRRMSRGGRSVRRLEARRRFDQVIDDPQPHRRHEREQGDDKAASRVSNGRHQRPEQQSNAEHDTNEHIGTSEGPPRPTRRPTGCRRRIFRRGRSLHWSRPASSDHRRPVSVQQDCWRGVRLQPWHQRERGDEEDEPEQRRMNREKGRQPRHDFGLQEPLIGKRTVRQEAVGRRREKTRRSLRASARAPPGD